MSECRFCKPLTLEEVFEAYYECRKTKRNSKGALNFEVNLEENIVQLFNELQNRTWQNGRSTCFIVEKPVKREIFAAPFRDRIVHHILINRLNPYFEKYFIFDSYACRKGKGTHAAIKRAEHFVKSEVYAQKRKHPKEYWNRKPSYVLKLDIQGFFMSINKNLLFKKLCDFIHKISDDKNYGFEIFLCSRIVFNNPCKDCIRKSPPSSWIGLPANKSLFCAEQNCGLPIGNLTSQVFANFYLTEFDHFMKHHLGIKKYIRYVDDCVIIENSSKQLKKYIKNARQFLHENLLVSLHPKKIYLQKIKNGFSFLGTFIKPTHTVCSRRVKNNFDKKIKFFYNIANDHKPSKIEKTAFLRSVNSYLGIMQHYKMYNFKSKLIKHCCGIYWKNYFSFKTSLKKIVCIKN